MITVKKIDSTLAGGASGKLADTFIATGPKDPVARKDVYNDKLSMDELEGPEGGGTALDGREEVDEERIAIETLRAETPPVTRSAQNVGESRIGAGPRRSEVLDLIDGVPASGPLDALSLSGGYIDSVNNYDVLTTEQRTFVNTRRLSDALGSDSAFRDLTSGEKKDLLEKIDKVTNTNGTVVIESGGSRRSLPGRNILDAQSMKTYDPSLSVKDISALAVIAALLLRKVMRNRNSQLADTVIGELAPYVAEPAVAEILSDTSGQAADESKLWLIDKIIDTSGPEVIQDTQPTMDRRILQNYQVEQDDGGKQDVGDAYTELVGVLDKLKPGWDKGERDGTAVNILSPYIFASDDALDVLATNERHYPDIVFARDYRTADAYVVAQRSNPGTILRRR